MAISKKKKVFLSIFIPSLLTTIFVFTFGLYWTIELLMMGHYVTEGINKYSPSSSPVSLCYFLTLRQEKNKENSFINKYPIIDSFYRYEHNFSIQSKFETVILSLTYDSDNFSTVCDDVFSQRGFSQQIKFDYNNYTFRLNDTERIFKADGNQDWCLTSYDISDNSIQLEWINLVGWCDEKNTMVFVGFYYKKNNRGYNFKTWDEMFTKYYDDYNW